MNNSFSSADLSSDSKCTTRQDRLSSFSPAVHSPGSLSLEALDIGSASGHMHTAAPVMRTRFDSQRDYCLTVSPEPPAGVIGQPRSASALANRPSHSLSIPSPPISATAAASASGQRGIKEQGGNGSGDVNGMVSEITQNLRRLADMIERNGYTGQLPLPNSPALTPSPSGQRPVFPLAGPTGNLDQLAPFINLDPIALRNLEMLARVADHNSPAAQPVPTSSHSTSLLQNPVLPVMDHRISPLLNPMHCSPTPPNSSTNTPTPPVAFNRMGKVNVMQIRCKFGQLGTYKGQFSSPHGFCLGMDEEIVIADTNNHRICVYDKAGEFKHSFGIAGKDEGQLWYPRKVAFIRTSNSLSSPRYVICDRGSERSRMQIFTRNGHFIRKIAIRYIDIVAGLAITPAGHIVAVDSVSPTVFVIAETGDLLRWFDCSEHMREPSDVAVANNEFYICDFKGHCVVVFSEEGQFLRRIGHEHLTNFPNGIDVSDAGDILIGDSHGNRFHVVVFDNSGSLLGEFECPYVKVSRCCGLKITSEGYVVTLAKNNHHVLILNTLYII